MPAYIQCPGCLEDVDVTIVSRRVVPLGDHYYTYIVTYRCNTCGQVWSSEKGR
jgi:uncharacterized Zn finger protein